MDQPLATSATPLTPPAAAPARPASPRISQRGISMILGLLAAAALIGLIAFGSRGFHWFDAALIGYAVATVFSLAAITYKYTFWLSRPQTGRYFWRSWQLFFSYENFRRYTTLIPSAIFSGLLAQWFISRRSIYRWVTHQCLFWGVVLSCCITFPLTFGWLRFTQAPGRFYQMWVFGFPLFVYDPASPFGFAIIHALDFTAILLLVGVVLAFRRHFRDLALIAIQRFRFDIVPLALLLGIVVTGLALTGDSALLGGSYYWFISLTHEAVVVLWLISLPFGKFFHIIERPATVGIELYERTGAGTAAHRCPRCGREFMPARFVHDLKRTLAAVGEDYAVRDLPPTQVVTGRVTSKVAAQTSAQTNAQTSAQSTGAATPDDQVWWQDFCPECKRVMRAEANLAAMGRGGNQFL